MLSKVEGKVLSTRCCRAHLHLCTGSSQTAELHCKLNMHGQNCQRESLNCDVSFVGVVCLPPAALFGVRFVMLLCLPEAHATSNVAIKPSPKRFHVVKSVAACFHSPPAVATNCRSGSASALYLTCVCRCLRGFCFSCSHHCRSFHTNIGLPPGCALAMCP